MRKFSILALSSALLLAGQTAMAEANSCVTLIDHASLETPNPWQTVNDGVMGGLSSGGSVLSEGVLTFAGNTNTNGGGFSSIRIGMRPGAMAGMDHLRLRVRTDARRYSVTLRTNVTSMGRRIAFRTEMDGAEPGNWSDAVVRFEDLKASIWGRPVRNAVFEASEVRELGLIIYDGKDGPFEMELLSIEACSTANGTGA
ncbi:MAG: CIA30 family protein [Pseudomonadota bacterium]